MLDFICNQSICDELVILFAIRVERLHHAQENTGLMVAAMTLTVTLAMKQDMILCSLLDTGANVSRSKVSKLPYGCDHFWCVSCAHASLILYSE